MSDVRPIPFAPGYFVSDDGCAYSEKYGVRRQLKSWLSEGYPTVNLWIDKRARKHMIHRLMAWAFIGHPPSPLHQVRHMDGIRTHCVIGNLQWGTHADNMADMVRHGTQGPTNHPERMARGDAHGSRLHPETVLRGEQSPTAKLTEANVRYIRARVGAGELRSALASEYSVSCTHIDRIDRRLSWAHIQ